VGELFLLTSTTNRFAVEVCTLDEVAFTFGASVRTTGFQLRRH
jgi:hypothetical protein